MARASGCRRSSPCPTACRELLRDRARSLRFTNPREVVVAVQREHSFAAVREERVKLGRETNAVRRRWRHERNREMQQALPSRLLPPIGVVFDEDAGAPLREHARDVRSSTPAPIGGGDGRRMANGWPPIHQASMCRWRLPSPVLTAPEVRGLGRGVRASLRDTKAERRDGDGGRPPAWCALPMQPDVRPPDSGRERRHTRRVVQRRELQAIRPEYAPEEARPSRAAPGRLASAKAEKPLAKQAESRERPRLPGAAQP